MTTYYRHPFTGKRIKLGGVRTKRCSRCKQGFYPVRSNQKLCPYCQSKPAVKGRPMHIKYCRIISCGKERVPNEGAKGLCKEHYYLLIKGPKEIKRKREASAKKKLEEGAVLCKMFQECEVYFYPKGRNQYGAQKFCPSCAQKRSWDKSKKK